MTDIGDLSTRIKMAGKMRRLILNRARMRCVNAEKRAAMIAANGGSHG